MTAVAAPPYERGWSTSLPRKGHRFLTRIIAHRTLRVPADTAIATISFDDVPDSAVTVGARVLERHGVRGTFYVSAGTCGARDTHWRVASRAHVRALHDAGHEIGCHTANHVNVQSLSAAGLAIECDTNADLLRDICAADVALTSFAYPFGDLGLSQKRYLQRRFETCRTIYEFVNAGRTDAARLGAIGLFDATRHRDSLRALFDDARLRGGWLVFYTHDVGPSPTFMGTSPALLDDTLGMLADCGIPVMTMRDAVAALAGQSAH